MAVRKDCIPAKMWGGKGLTFVTWRRLIVMAKAKKSASLTTRSSRWPAGGDLQAMTVGHADTISGNYFYIIKTLADKDDSIEPADSYAPPSKSDYAAILIPKRAGFGQRLQRRAEGLSRLRGDGGIARQKRLQQGEPAGRN